MILKGISILFNFALVSSYWKNEKSPDFYMLEKNCIKTFTNNVRQKQKLKEMRHRFYNTQ